MKCIIKAIIPLGLLFCPFLLSAQEKMKKKEGEEKAEEVSVNEEPRKDQPRNSFLQNARFGGNFGLSFGTVTYVQLSPMFAYMLDDHWMAGMNGTYIFYSEKINRTTFSTNVYGGSLFSRYILSDFFLQGEYESVNTEYYDPNIGRSGRRWVASPLLGAGYSPSGDDRVGSGAYIIALYNFNYNRYSPYASPLVIRIGYLF